MDREDQEILRLVMTRAWSDPEYSERLKANPKKVLEEASMELPDNIKFNIVENRSDLIHLAFFAGGKSSVQSAAEEKETKQNPDSSAPNTPKK